MSGEQLNSASVNDDSSSAATKRPRIVDSVSPTQEQRNSSLNILPGNTCGHCGKACTAKGKLSEAIQCDLCYVWVHAHCEGITKEHYKSLSYISGAVTNVAYYCEYNHCYSRIKQLVTLYINSNTDPTTVSTSPHQEESSAQPFNLSSKVGNLTDQTLQLETKVNQILDSLKNLNQVSPSSCSQQDGPVLHSEVAVDLVDELADRESRKCNLIVYNLSESSTPNAEADKSLFTRLCSSLSLQVHITAVTRLGKKELSKTRPLRVCLDNEATKRRILSRSSQLKSKPDWENVYVNPDMTLAERNANRLLRKELRERKNRGEKNLIIRRNKIVSLSKFQSVSMDVSPPTNLSNVSSSSKTTVSNTPSATSRADQSTSVTTDVPPPTS